MYLPRSSFRWLTGQSRCYNTVNRIHRTEYVQRRTALEAQIRKSDKHKDVDLVVLLRGSKITYMAPDVQNPFRQCSHFRYISGVTVPGSIYLLFYRRDGSQIRILFMDRRSEKDQLWEGKHPSDTELEETAAFDDILPTRKLPEILHKFATSKTFMLTDRGDWTGSEIDSIVTSSFASVADAKPHTDALRVVKSEAEINSMRDVCSMGARMMSATIAGCKGLDQERAVAGLFAYEAARRGAEQLAYLPVVAAGNRANTIHYLDANGRIEKNDCLLVDVGCDLNGYVSDISRCFPISGRWTDAQRTLYEALLFVQEEMLKYAGSMEKVRLSKLYNRMNDLIAAAMLEVGVIPKGTDKQKMLQMAEDICPHHVSHYLGMDVHDCVSVSRDIDLPPGVVFTIEPGVYIPANSTLYPVEFRGIGFRIEDDVMTTSGGIEVLTEEVPRTADGIEDLMNP